MDEDAQQSELDAQQTEVDRRQFVKTQLAAGFAIAVPPLANFRTEPDKNMKEKSKVRLPKKIVTARPHLEGAGVHLHRGFGFGETAPYDPFLLFDDFRNDDPEKYKNGFPWHPHRGIETITYVLAGTVDHADSLGNRGALGAGDIQWMTAGSGIMHQEMPHGDPQGRMHGFQLWANLPAKHKMTKPRYQDVSAKDIPTVVDDDGTSVRILCGDFWGKQGPVEGIAAEPRYLDISLPANTTRTIPIETTRHAFAYIIAGSVRFRDGSDPRAIRVEDPMDHGKALDQYSGNRSLVLFDQGDSIRVESGDEGGRFLLVSGEPIKEPVAWRGPIVMNTQEELGQAWRELKDGTFIKK
jgi:redox-sensitive bicupin YhaK (pirin superfamily)